MPTLFDQFPPVKFQKKTAKPHYKEVRFPLAEGTEPKHMVIRLQSMVWFLRCVISYTACLTAQVTVNWLLNDTPLSAKESLVSGLLQA